MYFTFLVITYNHEEFVLQHLESIKFQIINYGKNYSFQLVISDDCSGDRTIESINQWVSINGYLFKSIKILESDVNLGTCKNYVRGIKNIEGIYFKALAGDDLYAKDSIFKAVELLKEYDIVTTPVAPFEGSNLFNDSKIYSRIFSMYKFANTSYNKIRLHNIPIPMTPGIFMRRELISKEVIDFIGKHKFIEDRSQNIKIYELNNNLKIGKYEKILILYRHHENAVTKTKKSEILMAFNEDSRNLYTYANRRTKNVGVKLKTRYNIFN